MILIKDIKRKDNVGNNDRGDTVSYKTMRDGIFAIAKVLNNKYLGDYQTLDQLSRGGGNRDGPVYATSPENWHNNTSNCMHFLNGELA